MIAGEFDESVLLRVCRVRSRRSGSMIKQGIAFVYAEPEGLVISRSADETILWGSHRSNVLIGGLWIIHAVSCGGA